MLGSDKRPDHRVLIEGVTDLDLGKSVARQFDEFVKLRFMYEQPGRCLASLAGVAQVARVEGQSDRGQVDAREHDRRRLTAELEHDVLYSLGRLLHDHATGTNGTREGHLVNGAMSRKAAADVLSADDDVHDAIGKG